MEFFQRALGIQQDNGEVWSALGHCYLMQDDLQKAYAAYQQALYLLPNPKVGVAFVHRNYNLTIVLTGGPETMVRHRDTI